MNTDICWQSIPDVAKLIRSRSISPVELVQAHLARIAELNPRTNAFITVMEEEALEESSHRGAGNPGRTLPRYSPRHSDRVKGPFLD